ncbi:MAG: DUF3276 family protein [Bacteroidia bacterium]
MSEEFEKNEQQDLYTKSVRAGKRTYFFDVKSTKGGDYYLTITESKKRFGQDGKFFFEKHKIFLYKEDFDKFSEGLVEAVDYIKTNAPVIEASAETTGETTGETSIAAPMHSSDISFDDLGK